MKTVHGWANFRDGKTVEVETETGTQVIRAETVRIKAEAYVESAKVLGASNSRIVCPPSTTPSALSSWICSKNG